MCRSSVTGLVVVVEILIVRARLSACFRRGEIAVVERLQWASTSTKTVPAVDRWLLEWAQLYVEAEL